MEIKEITLTLTRLISLPDFENIREEVGATATVQEQAEEAMEKLSTQLTIFLEQEIEKLVPQQRQMARKRPIRDKDGD